MSKLCPTCVAFIKHPACGQTFIDSHNYVVINLEAQRPKWYHQTKRGRLFHKRAVPFVGERIDNSKAAVTADQEAARNG
jgi:hypothetical protein